MHLLPTYEKIHARLKRMDPEEAHRWALFGAKWHRMPDQRTTDPNLKVPLLGRSVFPFGLAAGVAKNAEGIRGFELMGLGFVEVGSVLLDPYQGNARSKAHPRIIRLADDASIINYMGLPSQGALKALKRVKRYRTIYGSSLVILVNITLRPGTHDPRQLARLAAMFAPYVQGIVINISCPNTAEVANSAANLAEYIRLVKTAAPGVPVLIKFGPTETLDDLKHLQSIALDAGAKGFVLLNTTPHALRHLLTDPHQPKSWLLDSNGKPQGGYSGPGAFTNTLTALKATRRWWGYQPVVIATGPQSAKQVIELYGAGADAVETNTWLTMRGPQIIPQVHRAILREGGMVVFQYPAR